MCSSRQRSVCGERAAKFRSSAFWHETSRLANLAIPMISAQLCMTFPGALVASYVGRKLGTVYLDGFTLAQIVLNITCFSILSGLLSAADTLQPQACASGKYREVGLLSIRAVASAMLLLGPLVAVVDAFLPTILVHIGQDPGVSVLATHWYRIFVVVVLPFYTLFNVTWKFLSAQEVVLPVLYVCVVSCLVVLPVALEVLLPIAGFTGSAYAYGVYIAAQSLSLVGYIRWKKPHTEETWPGAGHWKVWKEALRVGPWVEFMKLGLGGVASATEWWFWECTCMLVGTFGPTALSVHTVPIQFLQVAFMLPLGLGICLTIRLAHALRVGARRAKILAASVFVFSFVASGVISLAAYVGRERIVALFTSDPEVEEGCKVIWVNVCLYSFNLSIFGVNAGITAGLGLQWYMGTATVICLWFVGLPYAYYSSVTRGRGLEGLWSTLWPVYLVLNVIVLSVIVLADWEAISNRLKSLKSDDGVDLVSESSESLGKTTFPVYGTIDCEDSVVMHPRCGEVKGGTKHSIVERGDTVLSGESDC